MTTAVIIEDKLTNINILKAFLQQYCPSVHCAGAALTVEEACELVKKIKPDLIFLDIQLADGTGFDFLKKIPAIDFEVIFITAYNEYAVQAFRENAVDYLLKPIDIDRLQQAVEKAQKQAGFKSIRDKIEKLLQQPLLSEGQKISVPVREGYIFLRTDDIWYCEASGSYTNLHMKENKKLLASMRLKEFEEILPACFFRVHNSYLVNTKYITQYHRGRGGYIVMENGVKIEVSAGKKDEFLQVITTKPR